MVESADARVQKCKSLGRSPSLTQRSKWVISTQRVVTPTCLGNGTGVWYGQPKRERPTERTLPPLWGYLLYPILGVGV